MASRTSRGRPMVNLLPLEEGERINAILPVREFDEDHYIFMATANGTVKKTRADRISRATRSGRFARLNWMKTMYWWTCDHQWRQDVMLFSSDGKAVLLQRNRCARHGPNRHAVCAACACDEGQK